MEDLLKTEATGLEPCQVGSKTDRPCPRLAVVAIRGVPFCEQCAREQESYFTIGEMSQVLTADRATRPGAFTTLSPSSRR